MERRFVVHEPRVKVDARSWVGKCTETEGCVLQNGHAGECKDGNISDEACFPGVGPYSPAGAPC